MTGQYATSAWLWAAIVASGLYHGINPGMGWPLAVAAGLMDKSARALLAALVPLSAGHLLAMLTMLLPFAMLLALADWQRQIQAGASLLLIAYGVLRLIYPRHPRVLARIKPAQLALWSFVVAISHGAGLMLVPIYLGLCESAGLDSGHQAISSPVSRTKTSSRFAGRRSPSAAKPFAPSSPRTETLVPVRLVRSPASPA